jgi:2-polyprenyl-3-methyl-5-hydroxy-6-metoxy-1,4-benzoquinol methylase
MTMSQTELAQEWTNTIAPGSGDVRTQLVHEAADFLGIAVEESWRRLRGAGDRFKDEWVRSVCDRRDVDTLTRFYNQSDTELFELIEWHANDPIHYRTLIVRDLALARPGRQCLDYGSGIGNDAMTFATAGFDVTVADISDVLLAFASWRLRRRGFSVRTIDLKREALPADTFDLVACFDVLEHIPEPLQVVRRIHAALHDQGVFVMHAPFGEDPEHPMHVVNRDVVTPRMRSLGFQPLDWWFPDFVRAPQIYAKRPGPAFERAAYFVYDQYLKNEFGARLAALYRRTLKSSAGEAVR